MKTFTKIFSVLLILVSFNASADYGSVFGHRRPYYKSLKKFTRKGTELALGHLDTRFIWYATYKSEEFREQFAEFYRSLYPEGQDGLAEKLAKPWMNPSSNAEFFVALYGHDSKLGELGGKDSLWDLSLKSGDRVIKPLSVDAIDLSPFEVRFFPYIAKWYRLYRVVFPAVETSGQSFTLILSSVAGRSELKF